MKNTKLIYGLLIIMSAIVLTACPYTSKVPITEEGSEVDKMLMGKWIKTKDKEQEKPEYYEIKKYDKLKYEIDKYSYSSYDSTYTMDRYIAHITEIGGNKFMNMQKDGSGDFYLYKVVYDTKSMTLFEVTDNIDETFNTSSELKAFVEKNMNLSFFYNKEEVRYEKE